ncbi:MAG: hypothetical protein VB082_10175 [Christensenella sp.]|nr:hypothetical protein [Christensenella sp.]
MVSHQKKWMVLNIFACADVALTWVLFVNHNADVFWYYFHTVATVFLVILYIKILRLDALEALKPICGALILLIFVCPIIFLIPPGWSYHPQVWMRGTRGLAGIIVMILSIVYLVRARKSGRNKAAMVVCLILGGALSFAMTITTAW